MNSIWLPGDDKKTTILWKLRLTLLLVLGVIKQLLLFNLLFNMRNFPLPLSNTLHSYDLYHLSGCFGSILMWNFSLHGIDLINGGTSDLLILLTVEAFPDLLASTADLFKCLSMWPLEVYVDKQFLYVKNVVGFQEDINLFEESCFCINYWQQPSHWYFYKSVFSCLQVLRKSWNK